MNGNTAITISLSMYYSFVSDVGSFQTQNASTISSILSKTLQFMAKNYPIVYSDLSFADRFRLRCNKKDQVLIPIDQIVYLSLGGQTQKKEKRVRLLARAFLEEYFALGYEKRMRIIEPLITR
jgi:hypothetical protein